jgi:hypothetical protein
MSKKDDEITREEVVADLEKLQYDIKETKPGKFGFVAMPVVQMGRNTEMNVLSGDSLPIRIQ